MVPTSLAINKLEQGTENTFRGRDDNATVLQELSEKAMQERATGLFLDIMVLFCFFSNSLTNREFSIFSPCRHLVQ